MGLCDDVMTRDHERWDEFCGRMFATMGSPADHRCNGGASGHGHETTRAVLSTMGMDVPPSLAYLRAQGGCCCDCEVIMNVLVQDDDGRILDGERP